jgi:hypothetical protein
MPEEPFSVNKAFKSNPNGAPVELPVALSRLSLARLSLATLPECIDNHTHQAAFAPRPRTTREVDYVQFGKR